MITTTCDEKIESARTHINKAFDDLLVFSQTDTFGNSEYSDEFKSKVFEVLHKMLEIKELIN